MKTIYLLPLFLLLTGCTFTQHTHIAWLDPAYAPASGDSIWTLMNQKPKNTVAIYRDGNLPDRPYHEILMLAVEGNGNQEPDAVEAFMDLGRRAGAAAVIIKSPASGLNVHGNSEVQNESASNNGSEHAAEKTENVTISAEELAPNRRYLFQATAVVWDNHPAPSTSSPLPVENANTNIIHSPPQR